jgi:hypothetical protein
MKVSEPCRRGDDGAAAAARPSEDGVGGGATVAETGPDVGLGEWRRREGVIWWETVLGGARLVFTTRLGGGSASPL